MVASIKDVADPRIASFLEAIDRSRGGNRSGTIDRSEAALAARRIAHNRKWQAMAVDAFGTTPKSGAELLRFVENPPREEALERILGKNLIAGAAEMQAHRGRGQQIALGQGSGVAITPGGRISIDGKLPRSLGELSEALLRAAQLAPKLDAAKLPALMQRRLFATLSDALTVSLSGRRSMAREQIYASTMTLLGALARRAATPELRRAIIDRMLQGLERQRSLELVIFYVCAAEPLRAHFDPAQEVAWRAIIERVLPTAPPVEAYTNNRTKPLEVRHTIHEEFWKDELTYYSKKNGWTLIRKNAADTRREYKGKLVDPTGKKPPLEVHVVVQKGELDFLDAMGDPSVHAVLYSGHSSLGGNGSQAIQAAPKERGLPKLVFIANCRGRDNYAEFANKFPQAMLIFTDQSTYSDPNHTRIAGLYETLARGESFAFMRRITNVRVWDERADNYIFPDELRRFFFLDADEDGRTDRSAMGLDPLFNVRGAKRASDFTRAIAFVNSVLYWHNEIEKHYGRRPVYGKAYVDRVIAGGKLKDPAPGEVVRVTTKHIEVAAQQREEFFKVQFDPQDLQSDRDVYAGVVTTNVMLALAKHRFGHVPQREVLRAVLLGAQALHYLSVYEDEAPDAMRKFLTYVGLPQVSVRDIERIFEKYDSHGSQEQIDALAELLEKKHKLPAASFVVMNGKTPAPLV